MHIAARKHKPPRENAIALINIVFLLLVFFMLTSTIIPSPGLKINPAKSPLATSATRLSGVLALDASGRLAFGSKLITDKTLGPVLRQYLRQNPKRSVKLLSDRKVKAEKLLQLLTKLEAMGAKNIQLIVQKGQRP